MAEHVFLTKDDKISIFENNLVTLTLADGESFEALEPRRLFPVSRADEYITLLDNEGCEIAIIRSISDLSDESREVIKYSLDDYYLVPHITKIISTEEKYGISFWNVQEFLEKRNSLV